VQFFAQTSGTWINVATILLGTLIGCFLRDRLPARIQRIIPQAVGLTVLFVGMEMARSMGAVKLGVILGLIALTLGGILGEWWQLEERLTGLGDWLKQRFKGQGKFTEGFVSASLLFCVGPMALIGSLNNGMTGDNTILSLKSTMDGLASVALAGSYGVGVGFSSLMILIYQGGLSLLAGQLGQVMADPTNDPAVQLVTGTGGLMILGIGCNLLEIAEIRVAAFVPALAIAPLLYWCSQRFFDG
jgi:uncharacterized protein